MGITHTHGSTWAQRVPAEHWLEARPGDLVWCTAGPNGAESGWNLLLGPWGCGAEIVIHEGSFDAEQRLDLLQRLGVTILCQTPDEYRLLADAVPTTGPIQPGRLRHAVSVGEQADEEATQRVPGCLRNRRLGRLRAGREHHSDREHAGRHDQPWIDRAPDPRSRDRRDRRRRHGASGRHRG